MVTQDARPVAPEDDAENGSWPLDELARKVRVAAVGAVAHAGAGHIGGPLSAADLLVALYFRILRIRPEDPGWADRDRFILSKGHSSIALYATMAFRGYFSPDELQTYDALDSRLQGHPDMTRLPGLDMSTGSLGLGISAAVGMALGARLRGSPARVYVMLGDGECQEGSVWEAADTAARYRLENLTAIVDVNHLQQYGWRSRSSPLPLAPYSLDELEARWRAFGWTVRRVDGHEMNEIVAVLSAPAVPDVPTVVLAETTKGRGVPFMEHRAEWHARVPTPAELQSALQALGEPA